MKSFRLQIIRLFSAASALLSCCSLSAQTGRDTLYICNRDTVYVMPDPSMLRRSRPLKNEGWFKHEKKLLRPLAAAKTNLLLPFLNAGVLVPVSNRWSFGGELYYPWIPRPLADSWSEPGQNCYQLFGAMAEARLWLGRMHGKDASLSRYRLLGHSLGLICTAACYDWQRNWSGHQGEYYSMGIGYMYSCPLGKECAVYMQFEFALGVAMLERHPYSVYEAGGYLIRDKDEKQQSIRNIRSMHYGIPAKLGVSLVVPFKKRRT